MSFVKLTLDDVCDLITCGVAKRPNYVDNGIPFLSARNVKNQKVVWDNYRYISKDAHVELTKNNKPRVGDILYTRVGSYGEAAIVDKNIEFSVFVSLTLIKPSNKIFNKYLTYYLNSPEIKELAKKSISGSGVGNLNVSVVRKFPILLPPLPIQQKIVAKLDKIFAEIDKAILATETNVRNTKDFLNNFISEKLNKKNGKIIEFKKIIEVLTDYHANGSYKVLKKNVEIKSDKSFAWMVRSTDFENNFQNNFRYIDKKAYEFLKKSKIFGGEILMCKIGNAGEVYLMPKISSPCSLSMNLFLIRVNKNICITKFVYFFLISNNGKLQIFNKLKGATTKTITKENVKSLKIPLVDLETQKLFVKKIEEIEKITNNLIKKYNHQIDLFNILRNSILNQAFNGELVKAA